MQNSTFWRGACRATSSGIMVWQISCAAAQPSIDWIAVPRGEVHIAGRTQSVADFEIMYDEVAVGEYDRCVLADACLERRCYDDTPMVTDAQAAASCVNWEQARRFCAWLGARLPTEAEWDLAARGGELKDAVGDLLEWTGDRYERDSMFGSRVVRGGTSNATELTGVGLDVRDGYTTLQALHLLGFRCAR